MALTIDEMAAFCKRKGFVYPNSEIYGSMAGFFDYGPLGVELKNNLKREWWKFHVQQRDDIVGIDGSIITHPKVWHASGHVANFDDVMVECKKCHARHRADQLVEDALDIQADGLSAEDLTKIIRENNLKCPNCKSEQFDDAGKFNLMFSTFVGPKESDDTRAFLRPETAQLMFADFRLVQENARLKLPFGIAQIGKAFRNEISPRHFLFRCREFEQMEIEYFIHPKKYDCPFIKEVEDHKLNIISADMQQKKTKEKEMSIKDALKNKLIKTEWHAYWLAKEHEWFTSLGADPKKFRARQHLPDEKSHYALDTWDLEYKFPFGWKELQGMANRTDFDLKQHMEHSKQDLSVFDEETKEKVIPHVVAEPSQGVDRAFLVFMYDAYTEDKERNNVVLKLHPKLAPVKAAVFPLVNKPELLELSRSITKSLQEEFPIAFDKSGSVGRRYSRNDEQGTPFCITVDFDSLEHKDVTIRDRDSAKQIRVKIDDLKDVLRKLIDKEVKFEKAGKLVK